MRLKKSLWGVSLPFIFLCSVLCFWQVKRGIWKENLIQIFEATFKAAPIPLSSLEQSPQAYQKVLLSSFSWTGKTLLQPLQIPRLPDLKRVSPVGQDLWAEGEVDQKIFWVYLGWIPTVERIPLPHPESFLPPPQNLLTLVLPPESAQCKSLQSALQTPTLCLARVADPSLTTPPFPQGQLPVLPNNHRGYAWFWGVLAASILLITTLSSRKRSFH